ncbi:MAG: vanadium-dependent haloperoxidase [Bacteroidota bacterium]
MRPVVGLLALLVALPVAASPPDTAASVRWTAFALDVWAEASDLRTQARAEAARGDSTGLRILRSLPPAGRLWPLLALAQHDAARLGEAAVIGASAAALDALLPEAALRQRVAARLDAEVQALADTSGLAAGRHATLARLAAAPDDDPTWTGTVPEGPDVWRPYPNTEPEGAAVPGYRPWVLDRADRFRPPPPPAVGSEAFRAALDEVREATETRTMEQRRRARFWARVHGATEWTRRAATLLARDGTADPEAAAVLAALQVSIYDGIIACWEAKYHYWLIRPEQVDPSITRPWGVALPNFPAYPSGHACTAGAAETVLAAALPEAADEIGHAAWEMAESRLWGGVHYRFDNDAGLDLGRAVARYVLAHADRLGADRLGEERP